MTMLVKDESDIVENNIRYHASKGVDGFIVMDNGSTDGTLDILQALTKEFDLDVISNPEATYQQSRWMTELARLAVDELTPFIPN